MHPTLAFLQHITGIAHTQLNQCPACLNTLDTGRTTAVFNDRLKLNYYLFEAFCAVLHFCPISQRVFTIQAQYRCAAMHEAR